MITKEIILSLSKRKNVPIEVKNVGPVEEASDSIVKVSLLQP